MKQLIFASGWIFLLGGCDRAFTDKFDVPSAEIVGMDEAALPEDMEQQLTKIDEKLASIESQLEERLGAIERRLLNVEQGTGGAPRAAPGGGRDVADAAGPAPPVDPPSVAATDVEQTTSIGFSHTASADEHEYVGPSICAPCHLPQYTSWQKTKMANAFEALKPGVASKVKLEFDMDPNQDYTQVSACVGCHVTGYGKKGGFVDIETTPDLAGVTCEACHGPAGSYMAKGLKKNPEFKKADLVAEGFVDTVTIEQCEQCHNANSPLVDENYVFNFEENKQKGTHEHFPLRFKH